MTLSELLALLPDNTTGEVSPADMRTIVTNLYTVSVEGTQAGPWSNLPVATAFASLPAPGPVSTSITLQSDQALLLVLSGYVDNVNNNNEIALALDLSGATTLAAGTKPSQVLRVGSKMAVSSTVSLTYVERFNAGTTTAEIKYKAAVAGGLVSDLAFTLVTLG